MDVIELTPSEIRYSQDSISNKFGDSTHHAGQYIGETLDEIVRNPDTADRIPNISVFNKDGTWITLDNRRLWVFKKAEELGIVCFIEVSVKHRIYYGKFTTSDGRYVRVRGNNPGGQLWQTRQMEIERKQREPEEEMETERKQKEQEEEMETERKQIDREEEMKPKRSRRSWNKIKIIIIVVLLAVCILYWKIRN